jgi:accessory colonization factor AcfC
MKKYVSKVAALFAVAVMIPAMAFDVQNEFPPGGNSGKLAEMIVEFRKTKNHSGEVKFNPGCVVAKPRFDSIQDKALLVLATGNQTKPECGLDLSGPRYRIVDTMLTYTNAMCYRNDRKELGMKHFTDSQAKKKVASTVAAGTNTITRVSDKLGKGVTDSLNIVVVGNSGKARQVVLSNDFDYVFLDTDWAAKNPDKVTCLFTGSEKPVKTATYTIPTLKSIVPDYNPARWQDMVLVAGVNLTDEEIRRTRVELREMKKVNPLFREWATSPGRFENTIEDGVYEKIMSIKR